MLNQKRTESKSVPWYNNHNHNHGLKRRDISVIKLTNYWQDGCGLNPGKGRHAFIVPRPNWLWNSAILESNGHVEISPEVTRPKQTADHLLHLGRRFRMGGALPSRPYGLWCGVFMSFHSAEPILCDSGGILLISYTANNVCGGYLSRG
jgi:hypothetical protein